jgi:glycosyltransferase involved in cell wall biosynthesis
MKKLLIAAPYPQGMAPSQRFRFEHYLGALAGHGMAYAFRSFWSKRHWPAIYRKGGLMLKVYATLEGFVRRFFLLFTLWKYDAILLHREATPVGPPWWEWAAVHIWRKPLVYDFDDAIWLPNNSDANAKLVGRFKAHHKTARLVNWSHSVMAGNVFLAQYAAQHARNVVVVPTVVDTVRGHNVLRKHAPAALPVLGWTGTHSTVKQLEALMDVLDALRERLPYVLHIIADRAPARMPSYARFVPWSKEREVEDLLAMDVGIMPLYDTDWERGKCGFKALQYMALGIPAVVSAVGVNTEIVKHGAEGFLCEPMPAGSGAGWIEALEELLTNHDLRSVMGARARATVEARYSAAAWEIEVCTILARAAHVQG